MTFQLLYITLSPTQSAEDSLFYIKGVIKITRPIKHIDLSNNYLFLQVMSDKEICQMFLEKLLNIQIADLTFNMPEVTKLTFYDGKTLGFGVHATDIKGNKYEIVMQKLCFENKSILAERSRYYQSIIDADRLRAGDSFKKLPRTYIIFICTFDEYGSGYKAYIFNNRCQNAADLILQDGATTIYYT